MFAQEAIKTDVAASWLAACRAVGESVDVARFVKLAVEALGGVANPVTKAHGREALAIDLSTADPGFRAALPEGIPEKFAAIFELPIVDKTLLLGRTHPFVETLASHLVGTAIDDPESAKAARSGATRTKAVAKRTTLLLVRLRHHIVRSVGGDARELLAEECCITAFEGAPDNPAWLSSDQAERSWRPPPTPTSPPTRWSRSCRRSWRPAARSTQASRPLPPSVPECSCPSIASSATRAASRGSSTTSARSCRST